MAADYIFTCLIPGELALSYAFYTLFMRLECLLLSPLKVCETDFLLMAWFRAGPTTLVLSATVCPSNSTLKIFGLNSCVAQVEIDRDSGPIFGDRSPNGFF